MSDARSKQAPHTKSTDALDGSGLHEAVAEVKAEFQASGNAGAMVERVLNFFTQNLAVACPQWVHTVSRKLNQAGVPLMTAREYAKMTPFECGRAVGVILAALHYMRDGTLAPADDPESVKLQSDFAAATPQMFKALNAEEASQLANSQHDAVEFSRGLSEALRETNGGSHNLFPGNPRTYIYVTLLVSWREVVEFKNRTGLYRWLAKDTPPNILGSQRRFFDLCDDIGLRLGQRGRPQKNTAT